MKRRADVEVRLVDDTRFALEAQATRITDPSLYGSSIPMRNRCVFSQVRHTTSLLAGGVDPTSACTAGTLSRAQETASAG
jgi:hypothetical protein